MRKTWLITGCSSGLGGHIAAMAAARGDRVVATARDPALLQPLVRQFPENLRAVQRDVTRPASVAVGVVAATVTVGSAGAVVRTIVTVALVGDPSV